MLVSGVLASVALPDHSIALAASRTPTQLQLQREKVQEIENVYQAYDDAHDVSVSSLRCTVSTSPPIKNLQTPNLPITRP